MVFTRIKRALGSTADTSNNVTNTPYILLVEDDPEQMDLVIILAQAETKKLLESDATNQRQKEEIERIQLIKASNIEALEQAISLHKGALLALMDCNIPDEKDSIANDQFVKDNRRITGQHRSVDLALEHLPDTPITMISSLNRFEKMIQRYYESKHNLHINFISKKNQLMISRNIAYYLRQHIKKLED